MSTEDSVDIDDIIDNKNEIVDDILDDYSKDLEKEKEDEVKKEEKQREVEDTKIRPVKTEEMTEEYINEVVLTFLKHYKKKRLMRVKTTKKEVEVDIDFYLRKIKEIYTKENPFFIVNFKDILDYRDKQVMDKESVSRLIYLLTNDPYKVRDMFTKNVKELFKETYKNDFVNNFTIQGLYKHIQVGFTQYQEKPTQLNELRAHFLSKFITCEGVISQFDEKPLVRVIQSVWECDDCGRAYFQKGGKQPAKCLNKECTSRSFTQDLAKQINEDYMDVRLTQQYSGMQKTNTVDRYVRINGTALVNYILDNISPGQIAVVNGPVVLSELINPKDPNSGGDIEIDAFCIEQKNNVNIFDYDERLLNLVRDPINEGNINLHVDKIRRSVCPHIYKQEMVKEGALVMVVGTDAIRRNDGSRRKGDINILNVGNSGLAKSEYSAFFCQVIPHSMKAGTQGSTSVAGLTTFIETNPKSGKKAVSLGVLALCDMKGIACIEEINRRNKAALNEFANATDDNQEILVNKGGFHSIIHSRCPIYATANSLKNNGIWDDNESITAQTDLDSFILQRMDLIFVVRAEQNQEYKERLMAHLEKEGHNVISESEFIQAEESKNHLERTEEVLKEVEVKLRAGDFTGTYPIEYLRHEIYYLKTIHCRLVPKSEAWSILRKFWIGYSQTQSKMSLMATVDDMAKELQVDTMDVRKWNSLQKMAEAYGRLYRCSEVQPEHATMACNLMAVAMASTIPQIGSIDAEQANIYAKKMLDKATSNAVTRSLSREKAEIKNKTYHKFLNELNKFNNILYKQGHKVCAICHGTGQTTEVIDSENKTIETNDCIDCNASGGYDVAFSYLDFEANIVNNGVMSEKRCQKYVEMYVKKGFLTRENDNYYHSIDFKAPSTIDAVRLIAENFTNNFMDKLEEEEAIKNMNKRRMMMPTRASELNKKVE